jgi:ribonuclease E/ribonuclease G
VNASLVIAESDSVGLRAALVRGRRLAAIEIDRARQPSLVGAVGPARVRRIMPGLGAIIRFADGPELLLSQGRDSSRAAGDSVLVQVSRDPEGDKLGTATTAISLVGRALIHLPNESGVRVSRRLDLEPARRVELEASLGALTGGWILRRAAADLDPSQIAIEAMGLAAEAAALPSVALPGVAAPSRSRPPPDAFRRLVSDLGADMPPRILVAGLAARRAVERWCETFAPDLSSCIEYPDPGANLFDVYDLDSAVADLSESRVPLSNGASLIIEPTAALTAIDVNAGAETNILAVNLAAATEIARQLRLRHIGGLIVIDFISMARPADGIKIAKALASALADDPAPTHILPMSRFGLIEMTRDRRGPSLVLPA